MKKNIMVIFGGESSEHAVSCMSAISILENMDTNRYNCILVGITESGKWMLVNNAPDKIKNSTWIKDDSNKEILISLDGRNSKFLVVDDGVISEIKVDCIFPILHGKYGEDGRLQGLLDLMRIPYIGSGCSSSAIGFDKALTKEIVSSLGILQAKSKIIRKNSNDLNTQCNEIEEYFENDYPLFIKPSREGSSVGIVKVKNKIELYDGLKFAFQYDYKLIIEKEIIGREIEIAVKGSITPKASKIGELMFDDEFYSYDAKYNSRDSKTSIAHDIDEQLLIQIQNAALDIYNKLECKSLARVDFFLEENNKFIFNEINTIPGFTPISMYPQLWQNEGMTYKELITFIIEDAIEFYTNINN